MITLMHFIERMKAVKCSDVLCGDVGHFIAHDEPTNSISAYCPVRGNPRRFSALRRE